MPESYGLAPLECEALLRAGIVGRVAFMAPSGPAIVPVNYAVVDDAIMVRTSPDSLLGAYCPDAAFAFEVDQFDYPNGRGWSVVARGHARIVHPSERGRLRAVGEPRPWAEGPKSTTLRLQWNELTGRKLGSGWDPLEHLTVRRAVSHGPMTPVEWRSVGP